MFFRVPATCTLAFSLMCGLILALQPGQSVAKPAAERDGQHDFDFSVGTWKTRILRLQNPLSGSATWLEYNGAVTTSKVWGGRATLQETQANGPAGRLEGLMLRLYNPESHQWNLSFANSSSGTLSQPLAGEFKNGRGEFYNQEQFNGRAVYVRNVFADITPSSYRFEQAFSADGGATWETNWKVTLTRDEQAVSQVPSKHAGTDEQQRGFDWQFGSWKIRMSRLKDPLTGSTTWTPAEGSVVVRKIWGGRANLSEIEASGPSGALQFLSLRLYNPQSRQWSLTFAGSHDGVLSVPMIGEFKNGRGEFLDQEPFNGRTILVKFVYSDITANSDHSEQSFSADGGKTWEVNWINQSERSTETSDTAG